MIIGEHKSKWTSMWSPTRVNSCTKPVLPEYALTKSNNEKAMLMIPRFT